MSRSGKRSTDGHRETGAPLPPIAALAGRPRPYVMAHRGASDLAPENTPAAFRLAIDAGADLIETDLWFTRDDQIVCHHDETLDRLTGVPGRISDLSLAEVQRRPVISRRGAQFPDERIPSLADLIDLAPAEVVLAVELKDPRFGDPASAIRLVDLLRPRIAARTVVAISFRPDLLRSVRRAEPTFPIGHIALFEPWPIRDVNVVGPYWPLLFLNPLYVAWAHQRGRWVCPLDPHLHRRLNWYLRLGVDAVLTNDPAATRSRIQRFRNSRG